jgi:two-component system OmpR family response regulator
MRELIARVRALLRRRTQTALAPPTEPVPVQRVEDKVVTIGDLIIDRSRREITLSGRKVELSRKEFDLLVTLASNRGQVFDRQTLLNRVWGEDCYVEDRTVDVHIRWLREKIEVAPSRPERLLTVRGIGYKFSQ